MGAPYYEDDQNNFLVASLPRFLHAQKTKSIGTAKFMKVIIDEYLALWPLPNDGSLTAEKLRSKLVSWYYRNAKKSAPVTKQMQDSIFGRIGEPESRRGPQRVESYIKLYPSSVQAALDQHLALTGAVLTKESRLGLLKHVGAKQLKLETPDVLEKVEEDVQKRKAELEKDMENESPRDGQRTPAEYQRAIDTLPSVLNRGLHALSNATGWGFLIIGGGPYPLEGGEIRLANVFVGPKTAGGNGFPESYEHFEQNVQHPFASFLRLNI
ncbi:hypothetical protein BDN72DRAFT_893961, partial [Pluteus cervinus]